MNMNRMARQRVSRNVLRSKVGQRKRRISRRTRLLIRLKHVLKNIVMAITGLFKKPDVSINAPSALARALKELSKRLSMTVKINV